MVRAAGWVSVCRPIRVSQDSSKTFNFPSCNLIRITVFCLYPLLRIILIGHALPTNIWGAPASDNGNIKTRCCADEEIINCGWWNVHLKTLLILRSGIKGASITISITTRSSVAVCVRHFFPVAIRIMVYARIHLVGLLFFFRWYWITAFATINLLWMSGCVSQTSLGTLVSKSVEIICIIHCWSISLIDN